MCQEVLCKCIDLDNSAPSTLLSYKNAGVEKCFANLSMVLLNGLVLQMRP
ncbi:hypothetical protein SAMN05660900_03111 [Megasphaera cerevisiae DSM 20462]|nr:hypothetical protein SAMN05660900_03111 [Megasphaera cerevisiae DSM 20462]